MSTLDSTRAFLGMVGNLREFSVPWEGKELGVTLKRASEVAGGRLAAGGGTPNGCAGAPPVITSVKVRVGSHGLWTFFFCPRHVKAAFEGRDARVLIRGKTERFVP